MNYITIKSRGDGFGAQFQNIIYAICYADYFKNIITYVHVPIHSIEHNYNNDPDYNTQIEDLMNLRNNIPTQNNYDNLHQIHTTPVYSFFETNIDILLKSEIISKLKKIFWMNKNKNHFNNNCKNIAVHIRRPNSFDNRLFGADTPDEYYLKVINNIRNQYNNDKLIFHIYSQGDINNFEKYKNNDTILHIDEDICNTFIGLVAADILVMSRSSFSYTAGLLSDGIIYYHHPFYHRPASHWIVCDN
jgi:transcription initiation factor TFIID subunit 8